MDAIEPVYGTATLLIIAAVAVALLLFLIMKVKLHAFVSLVLVSLLTAVAAGIPIVDVPNALLSGFGGTLGSVALLVAFGVMLGRLLELTGGAQVLADTLINRFGEKRAPWRLASPRSSSGSRSSSTQDSWSSCPSSSPSRAGSVARSCFMPSRPPVYLRRCTQSFRLIPGRLRPSISSVAMSA